MPAVRIAMNDFTTTVAVLLLQALPAVFTLTIHRAMEIEGRAWGSWALLWLAMAFFSKSTKRRESVMQRIEHLFPATVGFALIFSGRVWRSLAGAADFCSWPDFIIDLRGSDRAGLAVCGVGKTGAGCKLERNDHHQDQSSIDPARAVPLDTASDLYRDAGGVAGRGDYAGIVERSGGIAFVFLALFRKARREELFLSQEFGEGFTEHRQHTGMFLPRFS